MSPNYYLDASALVKRYAPERGSAWIGEITDASMDCVILLSEITLAEVAAALAAKQRNSRIFAGAERSRVKPVFVRVYGTPHLASIGSYSDRSGCRVNPELSPAGL